MKPNIATKSGQILLGSKLCFLPSFEDLLRMLAPSCLGGCGGDGTSLGVLIALVPVLFSIWTTRRLCTEWYRLHCLQQPGRLQQCHPVYTQVILGSKCPLKPHDQERWEEVTREPQLWESQVFGVRGLKLTATLPLPKLFQGRERVSRNKAGPFQSQEREISSLGYSQLPPYDVAVIKKYSYRPQSFVYFSFMFASFLTSSCTLFTSLAPSMFTLENERFQNNYSHSSPEQSIQWINQEAASGLIHSRFLENILKAKWMDIKVGFSKWSAGAARQQGLSFWTCMAHQYKNQ